MNSMMILRNHHTRTTTSRLLRNQNHHHRTALSIIPSSSSSSSALTSAKISSRSFHRLLPIHHAKLGLNRSFFTPFPSHQFQIRCHRTLATSSASVLSSSWTIYNCGSKSCHPILLSNSNHMRCLSTSSGGSSGGGGKGPKRLGASLGLLTSAFVFLGKGKSLLTALKLTKFASLGSMFVSIGTYSMFFGLPYAAGMVGLILVHESGHALVMKHLGIPFSPMVFVPFVGAGVAMKEPAKNAYEEALVAFGGPVLGSIGAAGVAVGAQVTQSQLLFALADFGFMINLFNMMPLGMLDGGRITGAISPYAGLVGLGIGGTMIYNDMISNPIFYLVMLAGGYQTAMRIYYPHGDGLNLPRNYYSISNGQKMAVTGGYFGVVGALLMAMEWNARSKKSPEMLQRERSLGLLR